MLLRSLNILTLLCVSARASLFSSVEDLEKIAKEHNRLVFDVSKLVKNMEHDLAYVKQ
jgi:hypothetical protein